MGDETKLLIRDKVIIYPRLGIGLQATLFKILNHHLYVPLLASAGYLQSVPLVATIIERYIIMAHLVYGQGPLVNDDNYGIAAVAIRYAHWMLI